MNSEHLGVRFYETTIHGVRFIKSISVTVDQSLSGQPRTLDDVKNEMAKLAKAYGGNAVMNFRYGQRHGSFLRVIMMQDEVYWYGTGDAVIC